MNLSMHVLFGQNLVRAIKTFEFEMAIMVFTTPTQYENSIGQKLS